MKQDRIRRIAAVTALIEPLLQEHQKLAEGAIDDKGEPRAFNSDEFEKHTKLAPEIANLNSELENLNTQIRAIELTERDHEIEAERHGFSGIEALPQNSQEYREIFAQAVCGSGDSKPDAEKIKRLNEIIGASEYQNLTGTTPSTGTVLIPTVITSQIMMEAENSSALLRISDVSSTSNKIQSTPFLDELGLMAPREEGDSYVKSSPTMEAKNRKIYNFGMLFAVSKELREDVPALEAALASQVGRSAGYTVEEYGLKGDDGEADFFDQSGAAVTLALANKVPTGMLKEAGSVVPSVAGAATSTITYDELLNLKQAVHESADANGWFIISRDLETKALLLKDSDGRPLWQPSIAAGTPATMLGRPYALSSRVDSVASGNTPALFGDFRAAHKIDVKKNWMLNSSDHFYFGSGMIAYAADMRFGALTVLKNHIAKLAKA